VTRLLLLISWTIVGLIIVLLWALAVKL